MAHDKNEEHTQTTATLFELVTSPVAQVAGTVFVGRTACASADAVNVLVALGGVLGEVDARPEHSSDVGVTLIKAFVDDGIDEGGT